MNGLHEVSAGQHFNVLLRNVSAVQWEIAKGTVAAYASLTPFSLVSLLAEA